MADAEDVNDSEQLVNPSDDQYALDTHLVDESGNTSDNVSYL